MIMKFVVVALLLIVIYCLASAVYHLLVGKHHPEAMAKALTWRVGLSLFIFLLLLLSFWMGWLVPHAIAVAPVLR